MVSEAASWFPCASPRDDGEKRFLAHLRSEAHQWSGYGLGPEDTFANASWMTPLFVQLSLPGLTNTSLQVGYWQKPPLGHGLEGMWSDGSWLLDDERHDQDGLTVLGLDGQPEEFAAFTARWLTRQILRPVERLDWHSGGQVACSHWRLADTGLVVTREGSLWRTIKRQPTRVTMVREGGHPVDE